MGCGGGDGGSNPVDPPGGGANHAPTVNLNINNTHLAYGGTAQLSAAASDVDGDQVTFTWSGVLGTVSTSGPTSTAATFTAGNQWGQASVTVTASDGKGGSAQATALTYVRNPTPPWVCLSSPTGLGCSDAAYPLVLVSKQVNILVTKVAYQNFPTTGCLFLKDYSPPVALAVDVPHEFRDAPCAECLGEYRDVGQTWYVTMWCMRPEPDGGTFILRDVQWNPTSTSQTACFQIP